MNDTLLIDAFKGADSEPLHLEINVIHYAVENWGSNYSAQFKDLGKLVSRINSEILGKLGGSSASSLGDTKSSSAATGSTADTFQPAEREHQPYSPSGIIVPPIYPGIGGNDAFPRPGAGMYPLRGDFGSGGGSIVGPDHPIFTGRIGGQLAGFPGALPPGAPSGARFDPYGPPGVSWF